MVETDVRAAQLNEAILFYEKRPEAQQIVANTFNLDGTCKATLSSACPSPPLPGTPDPQGAARQIDRPTRPRKRTTVTPDPTTPQPPQTAPLLRGAACWAPAAPFGFGLAAEASA